jgi:hypothetical protein
MAALSLSGVGLQASPSRQSAHLLVTLTTSRTQQNHAPFEDPPRTGFWFGTAGSGISFQFFEPASNWYQRQLHWVFEAQQALSYKTSKPRTMGDGLTTTRYGKRCSTHHCQTFPMHRLSGAPSIQTYRVRPAPIQPFTPAHT